MPFDHSPLPQWGDLDRWNMHAALARIIASGVRTFAADLHSHPSDLTPGEWDLVLVDIVAGFEAFERIANSDDTDDDRARFDKGMALFAQWFEHLWD